MIVTKLGDNYRLDVDEEEHTLIVGATGSGKTLAIERMVSEYQKLGYTVLIIGNAKNNLESAFCKFKPTAKYHLQKLKEQNEQPTQQLIKLYHFFTPNFPPTKMHPYEIGTMDIKRMDRLINAFVFEKGTDTSSLAILNDLVESLGKEDSIFDLLKKIRRTKTSKVKEDLFSNTPTSINLQTILTYFSRFRYNPIFFPSSNFFFPSSKSNFNFEKILKDNKHYHIFDNRFFTDDKIKSLCILLVLNEVAKIKKDGKVKNKVVVVIDEVKALVPANPQFDYQNILAKLLADLLSILRTLGVTIISATQQLNAVNELVSQSFSEILYGKTMALAELNNISKTFGWGATERELIMGLEHNQFLLFSQESKSMPLPYTFNLPTFAHAERNEHFDRKMKELFPEKLISHRPILSALKKEYQNQEKGVNNEDV